jgi:eukaryotic-like serine/threonine-protein kinase
MQLWTDYEGVTIDGAFPLKKLLLPEGRSAFFSTAGSRGEPTVVRLIECHFDEEEILARWRSVEALNHPNFLKFERYGQVELDGGRVVYAVFEKVDANLAEVLDQGHLTVKDVAELASSLVAALEVLHTNGFIHEHIEPSSIFAVGDVVKLRSDCIHEAPEKAEGRAAKQRDVRDLVTVLLQALTQRRSLEGIPEYAVPAPFGQIIRNGLDGAWGLENIRAALGGQFGSRPSAAPELVDKLSDKLVDKLADGSVYASVDRSVDRSIKVPPVKPAVSASPGVFERKVPSAAPQPSMPPEAQLPLPLIGDDPEAEFVGASTRRDTWDQESSFSLRSRWVGAAGIFAVLLLFTTWVLPHAWNAHRHKAAQAAAADSQPAAQSVKQVLSRTLPKPAAEGLPRASALKSDGSHAVWRVIAFTYNRKTDAEKKVSSLARSRPNLQPVVFSARGRAPYLVSIGGAMDRDAAYALARRARSLGLPRDTYAQNYSH